MSTLPNRERVPEYHYASEQSKALIDMLEDASLEAKAALEDVMAQFFVDTATWGLTLWEQQVGIETRQLTAAGDPPRGHPAEARGQRHTTSEMIRGLAEALTGYEAKVEVNDDYSFFAQLLGREKSAGDHRRGRTEDRCRADQAGTPALCDQRHHMGRSGKRKYDSEVFLRITRQRGRSWNPCSASMQKE